MGSAREGLLSEKGQQPLAGAAGAGAVAPTPSAPCYLQDQTPRLCRTLRQTSLLPTQPPFKGHFRLSLGSPECPALCPASAGALPLPKPIPQRRLREGSDAGQSAEEAESSPQGLRYNTHFTENTTEARRG